MRSPKGGRLLQIVKPMPRSCNLRTAATAEGRYAFSVVTRVPSTSVMTSFILLTISTFKRVQELAGQYLDAAGRGDNDGGAAADEQSALDDANGHADVALELSGVGDPAEFAIENVVAAIGDEGVVLGGVAQYRVCPKLLELCCGRLPAELGHLDRHRGMVAELIDQLFLIDDDDQPVAGRSDDLLAQQRAAEALDQVQRATLDLVGAVDRQIDARVLGEGGERDVESTRLRGGPLGGRDADDLQPLRHPGAQTLDDKIRRRAGAEAEGLANKQIARVLGIAERTVKA